jgi:protein phosphatase
MANITFGHRTDTGRQRTTNQDNHAVVPPESLGGRVDGLFVVADGMGGHAGGEIASRVAVDTLPAVVAEALADSDGPPSPARMVDALREAIASANEAVWKQARANPELRGMGTTCVALLMRNGQAAVAHVGDSRIYLLRQGALRQITEDHSLVQERVRAGDITTEEAQRSRFRNVITRAVGIADEIEPDVEVVDLAEGDTFLLCSDGLTTMVPEPEIARVLARSEPQAACDALVDAANRNGGEDNVTAIVVRHGMPGAYAFDDFPPETPALAQSPVAPGRGAPLWTLPIVVLLCLALGSLAGYFTHARLGSRPVVTTPKSLPPPIGHDLGHVGYAMAAAVTRTPVLGAPVACDSAGNVYVVGKDTGRVVRLSPAGVPGGDFATPLARAEQPQDLHWASDPQGYLYVSRRKDHRIEEYAPSGTRVATIGERELKAPEGVAVDSAGDIYVVDGGHLKVFRALPAGQPAPADGGTGRRGDGGSASPEHATRDTGLPIRPGNSDRDASQNPQSAPTNARAQSTIRNTGGSDASR